MTAPPDDPLGWTVELEALAPDPVLRASIGAIVVIGALVTAGVGTQLLVSPLASAVVMTVGAALFWGGMLSGWAEVYLRGKPVRLAVRGRMATVELAGRRVYHGHVGAVQLEDDVLCAGDAQIRLEHIPEALIEQLASSEAPGNAADIPEALLALREG